MDAAIESRQDLEKLKAEISAMESRPLDAKEVKTLRRLRTRLAEWGAFLAPPPWPRFPELPDDIRKVLQGEREELRNYVSGHPIDHLKLESPHSALFVHDRGADERYLTKAGTWVELAGVVTDAELKTTRRGSQMAFFGIECLDGVVRCLSFSDNAEAVANGWVIRAKGVIEDRDEDRIVKVTKLQFVERW